MKDFQITLIDKREIAENTMSFIFDIKDIDYEFTAGQYAHFSLIEPLSDDKKNHTRPLSIASSPGNKSELMIAARTGSSDFIKNLISTPVGSKIFVSKPSGVLKLHSDKEIQSVFIAGGIGITPVRSIIEYATQQNLQHRISLFYSNKTESQTAFADDFEKWSSVNKNFKFIPVIDVIDNTTNTKRRFESGPLDKNLLFKYLGNLDQKYFYVTGPPQMVESVNSILLSEGADGEKIITEKFK